MLRHFLFSAALTGLSIVAAPAHAQLNVATWNINGGEKTDEALAANAAEMQAALLEDAGNIDILILQEVISENQVKAVADGLGLEHWVISDFSPPVSITGKWYRSLETAIVSRLPIRAAMEWDATGSGENGDGYAPRISNPDLPSQEIAVSVDTADIRPSRGFLRADIGEAWTVYAVHWKSSQGASCNVEDLGNTAERELQARALLFDAKIALAAGRTTLFGGDFNIQAPGRVPRSGTDPDVDCTPTGTCEGVCGQNATDGYDDSLTILAGVGNSYRLLSENTGNTYVGRFFSDHAIDHLAVAGPRAGEFKAAKTPATEMTEYFGSDHTPVYSQAATAEAVDDIQVLDDLNALIEQTRSHLSRLERLRDTLRE